MNPGQCKHFNGIQNDRCDAGLEYPGRPLPCLTPRNGVKRPDCVSYAEFTAEEIAAWERETDAVFARVEVAVKAIRARHGKGKPKESIRDEMVCPNGCGGQLRYSVASHNGHTFGSCTTPDCCKWME